MRKKYKIYTMTDLVDVWYQIKVGYFLFYWWVCEEKEEQVEKTLYDQCIPFSIVQKCNPMRFDSAEEADDQIKIWSMK